MLGTSISNWNASGMLWNYSLPVKFEKNMICVLRGQTVMQTKATVNEGDQTDVLMLNTRSSIPLPVPFPLRLYFVLHHCIHSSIASPFLYSVFIPDVLDCEQFRNHCYNWKQSSHFIEYWNSCYCSVLLMY